MARFLEAFHRRHPSPSGEPASPRRDRRVGKAGSLATAATLLLAVPGVALATMGNTGEGGGTQHSSVSVRHGQGNIHPAGAPGWCLAGEAGPSGTPPQANSHVEVRPCAQDNPFQLWDVTIDETPGKPDKMIAQIHGLNLCLSGQVTRPRREAIFARINDCNLQTATLNAKEGDGAWSITKSNRTLTVPSHLQRHATYPLALWIDNRFINDPRTQETENPLFVLPSLSRAGGGNPTPPTSR